MNARDSVPAAWRRDAAICAGLLALAAVVRVLFLLGTADRGFPFSVFYYGDSRVYREFALAILRGAPFDQGLPFHPPGFAWLLAWGIEAVGERPTLLRALLAVLSATAAPVTYLLGARLWGRTVGVVAALLFIFSFGACVAAVSANVESIYLPIVVAQVFAAERLASSLAEGRGGARRWAAACGALIGCGALVRAEHLGYVWIVPLALLLAPRGVERRRVAAYAAICLGVAGLVVAPWVLSSGRSIARFNEAHPELARPLPTIVPVSGYGPLNFALANHAGADGTFRPDALVPGMGTGRLRPDESASVSSMRMQRRPTTRPSRVSTSWGAERYSIFTASDSAAWISSSQAGISARVRR